MEEYTMQYRTISCNCIITTTLNNFSSCSEGETVPSEYDCKGDDLKKFFEVKFYANGNCARNKGYVSIIFNSNFKKYASFNYYPLSFSCVASVIDASDNKRFLQTFASESDSHTVGVNMFNGGFGFDQYIKRSHLLNDSSELLPDDSLMLCMEIRYEIMTVELKNPMKNALDLHINQDVITQNLRIDSKFGQKLCKISRFFQIMQESSGGWVENETRQVSIPTEEESSFTFLSKILYVDNFTISTMKDICDLYTLADKYDIKQIAETCHQLLISMMHKISTQDIREFVSKDIHMLLELANTFIHDIILREIYSEIKSKLEGDARKLIVSNFSSQESEWTCEYLYDVISRNYYIQFSKIKSADVQLDIFK